MSVGFILFEWSNNEKFFSLHSLGKCEFTYFALVWRWSFRGIMLKTATCFWVLRVITISVINFSIISSERSKSRSFAPTCHTKWPGFCLSDGFAWSFRYFSYLRSRKSFDIYNALFTFSAISHLFTCFTVASFVFQYTDFSGFLVLGECFFRTSWFTLLALFFWICG